MEELKLMRAFIDMAWAGVDANGKRIKVKVNKSKV